MFLQFSPPVKKNVVEKVITQPIEEIEVLSLAPFAKNPKICFDNVTVTSKVTKKLLIQNPLNRDIQILAKSDFPDEIGVTELSWDKHFIKSNSEIILEITWIPKTDGAWRHMIHVDDGNRIQKDIPVIFKSVIPKTNKTKKPKGKNKNLPKFKIKSPMRDAFKKKSPMKSPQNRPALPNIINISNITVNQNEKKITITQGKENHNCVFITGPSVDFDCEHDVQRSRRSTYTVQNVMKNPVVSPDSEPVFVDSLEMNPSPRSNNTSTDIAVKLESLPFKLSPITPQRDLLKFEPACCSTDEKSRSDTCYFKTRFSVPLENNITFQITSEDIEKTPNFSTETYVKDNLSTETYVKENTSSETYTKADISSSTYMKESPLNDFTSFQFSPLNHCSNSTDPKPIQLPDDVPFEIGEKINFKKNGYLSCIKEESCSSDTFSCSSAKRKSNVTFDVTPKKRVSLGISDWSKRGGFIIGVSKKNSGLNVKTKTEEDKKCLTVTNTSIKEVRVKDPLLLTSIEINNDASMTALIHYDEEWMNRQQENFKKWLNSLLTPTELSSNEGNHLDIEKIWEQCRKKDVPVAVTKELVSCRCHVSAKLKSLRKTASILFKSQEVQKVISKVDKAVDEDKLVVRQDRDIHLDLFLQSEIMSVILSYNPLWLRIGLETVYSETIPMNSNSDVVALSSFILERFFKDPFLLKKHKTVHSLKYCRDIKKFILKKFLVLVYFLDKAKTQKLIQHDPCLFRIKSQFKESRELLLKFARDTLLAVGDVTKYLKHFGYVVSHKQTYIDEFDYGVKILGVDLRDGVRLTRIAEIVLMRNDLSKNLRVPAISRLQKVHNMKIVFDALEQAGFKICNEISPKDIVDGHREKTLSFLWQIIYKFQTPLMIKCANTIQQWWRSTPILIRRSRLRKIYRRRDNAAKKIQLWYRKRLFLLKLEKFITLLRLYIDQKRKDKAATSIQSYVKMYQTRRRFLKLRNVVINLQRFSRKWLASESRAREMAAIKIQSFVRMFIASQSYRNLKYYVLLIEKKYLANKQMKLEKERYENLKYVTLQMQNIFRANRYGREVRKEFTRLKTATVFVQRHFRANIAMKVEREKFILLKKSAIVIQRRYRAITTMRMERQKFEKIRTTTISVQRRYRAKIIGRIEKNRFMSLKQTVIATQRRYRALILGRKERTTFMSLKYSAFTIQKYYRAKIAGQIERARFICLRNAILVIQRHFRAYICGKEERSKFISLRNAALCVQRRYKARLLGRIERNKFLCLRQAVLTIQRHYRALLAARKERTIFTSLRAAAIMIQQIYRARCLGRIERREFMILRQAAVTIQKRYRAVISGREERFKFVSLKHAAITIQRRYRARVAGESERNQFLSLKKATVTIQRRYKAKIAGREEKAKFISLKKAAVFIQQRYRANVDCRNGRDRFKSLKKATITIQRRYRAKISAAKERAKFMSLRNATVTIQRRYRCKVVAKKVKENFITLRKAAIVIQRRYRAKIFGRVERNAFTALKNATMIIQRRFRAIIIGQIERERFLSLKKAIITIQRRYRAIIVGRTERHRFLLLKSATEIIQQRYRGNKEMKKVQNNFIILKRVVVMIQRRYRAKLQMRQESVLYQNIKNAAIVIQRFYRNYRKIKAIKQQINIKTCAAITVQKYLRRHLVLKQYGEAIQERKKQNKAAAKIQATWKGYKTRSAEVTTVSEIRKRLEEANKNAVPHNTLGFRCKKAVLLLRNKATISEIIRALEDIEFVTRRCRDTCLQMSSILSEGLYITITSTNRSPPEMKACTAATNILIDFYKYPPSRENSFVPEYIDKLITVMLHWCDKEAPLFPAMCTLIWLFCHTMHYKRTILESPNFWQKMSKMESLCIRREKMVSRVNTKLDSLFSPNYTLPLPSLTPDWGLQDRPKVFLNSMHGLDSLLRILKE